MTSLADLYRAILLDPLDDIARLAWADRLEDDIGQNERSEFVRVQVYLEQLPAEFRADWVHGRCSICDEEESGSSHYHCCECGEEAGMMGCGRKECEQRSAYRVSLESRERVLLPEYGLHWLESPPLRSGPHSTWGMILDKWPREINDKMAFLYSRGFVDAIFLTLRDYLQYGSKVFIHYPVTTVMLVDRTPFLINPDYYIWNDGGIETEQWNLPRSLFRMLPGHKGGNQINVVYSSQEKALEDLSRACVNHARRLTGLPLLWNPA